MFSLTHSVFCAVPCQSACCSSEKNHISISHIFSLTWILECILHLDILWWAESLLLKSVCLQYQNLVHVVSLCECESESFLKIVVFGADSFKNTCFWYMFPVALKFCLSVFWCFFQTLFFCVGWQVAVPFLNVFCGFVQVHLQIKKMELSQHSKYLCELCFGKINITFFVPLLFDFFFAN